jgi:hypothetical protein
VSAARWPVTWTRQTFAAALPVAAVAVIAGIVSYSHIEHLALVEHQPLPLARLFPFAVDGLIAAGSVVVLGGEWLGWLAVVPGVAATLFANIESGIGYGPLAATVAAWPAVAFSVASFVLERWLKRQVGQGGQGGSGVAHFAVPYELPEAGMGQPNGTAAPPSPVPSQCGHTVAGTPEENVVNAYLHERDCLGGKPSQRQLAATYGVSRPKVAQLVGPHNGQHPDN